MKAFVRYLFTGLEQFWSASIVQAALRTLLQWTHALLAWCRENPGGVVGGIIAFWLAHLFAQVPMTRALMEFAFGGLGMVLFYAGITTLGALIGSGRLDFKSPMDRR